MAITMGMEEVIEEIRTLLREPQETTVENPWNYAAAELTPQIRSSLRHLRVSGLNLLATMDDAGAFVTDPTEIEGVLISLFVAERLISGDLIQKLLEGELGIYLNAGGDVIDTKTATLAFRSAADRLRYRYDTLVQVSVANNPISTVAGAFLYGGPCPYRA